MPDSAQIDTLIFATVLGGQAGRLLPLLREQGYAFTEISSIASLVEEPVTSLLIGISRDRLDSLLELVRQCCSSRVRFVPARLDSTFQGQPLMIEAMQGGATLFAFEVEQFIQI